MTLPLIPVKRPNSILYPASFTPWPRSYVLYDNAAPKPTVPLGIKVDVAHRALDDVKTLVNEKLDKGPVKLIANLPYYITTPIVMKFLEEDIPVTDIVVMVQKEVGDRFKATPNTKDYNSLSIYLNYYFDII